MYTQRAQSLLHLEGAFEEVSYRRLQGTSGTHCVIGEVSAFEDDMACWKLHPAYAEWFWPMMTRVSELVLLIPTQLLEPFDSNDSLAPPRSPSESTKRQILKLPERPSACARVYTLRIPGKTALVHRAFPTRLANLGILREIRAGQGEAS